MENFQLFSFKSNSIFRGCQNIETVIPSFLPNCNFWQCLSFVVKSNFLIVLLYNIRSSSWLVVLTSPLKNHAQKESRKTTFACIPLRQCRAQLINPYLHSQLERRSINWTIDLSQAPYACFTIHGIMESLSGYGLCKKKFEPPVVLLLQMHRRPFLLRKERQVGFTRTLWIFYSFLLSAWIFKNLTRGHRHQRPGRRTD